MAAEVRPAAAASVVIPVLNDADALRLLIDDLRQSPSLQIIVVDGGSSDDSLRVAREADLVLSSPRGRGRQIRLGVERADGDCLWFLHADSRVSAEVLEAFQAVCQQACWGWFDVRLEGNEWPLRVIATAMNWRSALTSVATGDQGIFVHRRLLDAAGGVPPLPLMEDVTLCKRLRRLAKPRRLGATLETSSRRWREHGVIRTVVTMWALRLRYFLGADAEAVARRYYGANRDG